MFAGQDRLHCIPEGAPTYCGGKGPDSGGSDREHNSGSGASGHTGPSRPATNHAHQGITPYCNNLSLDSTMQTVLLLAVSYHRCIRPQQSPFKPRVEHQIHTGMTRWKQIGCRVRLGRKALSCCAGTGVHAAVFHTWQDGRWWDWFSPS